MSHWRDLLMLNKLRG